MQDNTIGWLLLRRHGATPFKALKKRIKSLLHKVAQCVISKANGLRQGVWWQAKDEIEDKGNTVLIGCKKYRLPEADVTFLTSFRHGRHSEEPTPPPAPAPLTMTLL